MENVKKRGGPNNLKPFTRGNPGGPGRPKLTEAQKTARQMARALIGKAMERLEYWSLSDEPKASVAASVAILNRAEGMPKQETDLNVKGQLTPVVVNVTIGGPRPLSAQQAGGSPTKPSE